MAERSKTCAQTESNDARTNASLYVGPGHQAGNYTTILNHLEVVIASHVHPPLGRYGELRQECRNNLRIHPPEVVPKEVCINVEGIITEGPVDR